MTRYQMAVVVARMLEKMHVLKENGRQFTARDIANLEALTIEFADELALLNVERSPTLENQVSVLRKGDEVDALKVRSGAPVAPSRPITGLISARTVFTSSGRPRLRSDGGFCRCPGFHAGASGGRNALHVALPGRRDRTGRISVVPVQLRVVWGTPWEFDSRTFATIAFSSPLNPRPRQVTKDIEFHMQVDAEHRSGRRHPKAGPKAVPQPTLDTATGTATRFGPLACR